MALPIEGISDAISGIAALGIAAYGLVDASKALRGGASNHGLSDISDAITPFDTAFGAAWRKTAAATLIANWLNGVAKDEQKAAAKGLVRLGLTATTARLVAAGTNVDAEALATAAQNIEAGTALTQKDLNVLGRFDPYALSLVNVGNAKGGS